MGLTHCVFLGISHMPADRREIDDILGFLSHSTNVIVANPRLDETFRAKVEEGGRPLLHWNDGPQPIV